MTDECISPLRGRMIEDMTVRNFVPKTQSDYIRRIKNFAVFLGRSPNRRAGKISAAICCIWRRASRSGTATAPVRRCGSFSTSRSIVLRCRHLPIAREPRKAPIVLSPEEVARMLEATPGLKYKAALSVAYGAGLRVSEVVALKVSESTARG